LPIKHSFNISLFHSISKKLSLLPQVFKKIYKIMTSLRRKPKKFTYPSMCKESMKLPCDMKLHVDIFTIERNLLQMNPESPASNRQVLSPPALDGHTAALLSFLTRGNSSP
jgi:hypothetical protein